MEARKVAETGHFIWEAFKHPKARCWGFRDELGFAYISNDRDGWVTNRLVKLLNEAEAKEQRQLNPHLKLGSVGDTGETDD